MPTPLYWCPNDEVSALIAPVSDIPLQAEIVGTMRLIPLSSSNTSNFLSTYLSDLYLAAVMIFMSGYQRDFGQQSDDPKLAVSWEAQYQVLLRSAEIEEARKKFADMFPRPSKPTGLSDQMPSSQ